MKRKILIYAMTLISIMGLSGCKKDKENPQTTSNTISLYVDGVLYDEITIQTENSTLLLPIMEKEDFAFTGWTDGTNYYGETITVESKTGFRLDATFEAVNDIFIYSAYSTSFGSIMIEEYTGEHTILFVPQMIEGYPVTLLSSTSIKNSTIKELYLPYDITIGTQSISNNTDLEKIAYYGETVLIFDIESSISETEYNAIIEQDGCEITETITETNFTFNEECSIKEVLYIDEVVLAVGTFRTYHVIIEFVENDYDQKMYPEAIQDNINLTMLEFSPKLGTFFTSSITGSPNLLQLSIAEDNAYFMVNDNILYSKYDNMLMYYPSGLTNKTFDVPDHVRYISSGAFYEQEHLEVLNIDNVSVYCIELTKATSLKEVNIINGDQNCYSVDGVVYSYDTLFFYPPSKDGSEFTVPETVTEIHFYAFAYNKNLENLDLNNVEVVRSYAFAHSESLTHIVFPEQVTEVSYNLFEGSNVTEITFLRDDSLGFPTRINQFAFNLIHHDFTIYVPEDVLSFYRLQINDEFDDNIQVVE